MQSMGVVHNAPRSFARYLDGLPVLRVLPHGHAAGSRVHVVTTNDRRGNTVEPPLSVDLPLEALGVLLAGVVPVTGTPLTASRFLMLLIPLLPSARAA